MFSRLFDYVIMGIGNVLRHKLRSVLTAIGIILGISALLSMMAVGEGAREQILLEMERMGLRNIIVSSRRPPAKMVEETEEDSGRAIPSYGLTFKDLERCKEAIPGLIRALPVHEVHASTYLAGRKVNTRVLGIVPDYFKTFPMRIKRGRTLCQFDGLRRYAVCTLCTPLPVAVIRSQDPLGMAVPIGNHVFRVVGIVTPRAEILTPSDGSLHGGTPGKTGTNVLRVFIPYKTALARYGTVSHRSEQGKRETYRMELDQIILQCRDPIAAVKPLEAILEVGHKEEDYEITVPVELLHQRQQTQAIFNLVMLLVASLTLLVGGVGIVNIMLVSVAERTKEIGIRRALGARRKDITLQFLIETIILTMTGGALGCIMGLGGVRAIEAYTGWPVSITLSAVFGSLLVSMTAGIVFGLYPARKAASISPVVALRYE